MYQMKVGATQIKSKGNQHMLRMSSMSSQVKLQSAQPAKAGGAAETNQKHALAFLLVLLLFFAQCKMRYGD